MNARILVLSIFLTWFSHHAAGADSGGNAPACQTRATCEAICYNFKGFYNSSNQYIGHAYSGPHLVSAEAESRTQAMQKLESKCRGYLVTQSIAIDFSSCGSNSEYEGTCFYKKVEKSLATASLIRDCIAE